MTRTKRTAGTKPESQDWIRNAADEKAVAAGMRFDLERAEFVCNWIETYCYLYEGEKAGEPMILLPCWRDFFSRLYGWVYRNKEWDGWVRRFNRASFWGAKKNAKSPNCAAHNLYLLCGDGEQGQKVYQGAANGEQAKIAQMHAVNMVKQSPELYADCKINNATLEIRHLPSNSSLVILTGDDSRGAKTKEGINGSVSFDEMHVVNREMEERTSRAGISRREPINASFSTAGDDPSSVGAERFRYGRQVNNGDRNDPHFLHVEFCAPDVVTESSIDANLEAYGRAANPAWGSIVKPSEFRADWERSKGNAREVARFKQYRLNLWVGSTNQWLDLSGWEAGAESFDLESLRGRDCYMALDLSRTRDMTACVLMFPEEEERIRIWPMFWLPDATAKARNHLFPFLSWAASGHLHLTPGSTVDYGQVKEDIRAVVNGYNLSVLNLYYDPHYANELTQALHEGESVGAESVPGVVHERTAFAQTLMYLTGPAKEFERRVTAGLIRHPSNPVMTWQVGHAEVWSDRNNNIRPVKPEPHSGKAIDGVICCVMATAGTLQPVERPSISFI